jgi:hypothetical protein
MPGVSCAYTLACNRPTQHDHNIMVPRSSTHTLNAEAFFYMIHTTAELPLAARALVGWI